MITVNTKDNADPRTHGREAPWGGSAEETEDDVPARGEHPAAIEETLKPDSTSIPGGIRER